MILLLFAGMLPIYFFSVSAQKLMNMADYEKRKRAFVQKEANLSKEEAAKYFPLNDELTQKKFDLHKRHREKVERIKENSHISEEEYQRLLADDVDLKVKEAALDKEYSIKFSKILSPEKLFKAQQAEKRFIQNEVSHFRSTQGEKR